MQTQCPRCGAMLPDPGKDFPCPGCGAPVRSAGEGFVAEEVAMGPLASVHMSGEPGWKALPRALQHLARLGSFILFFVSLVLCFAALLIGIPMVFEGAPGSDLNAILYVLTPAPLGLFEFGGTGMAAYHLFLAAAITASLACLVVSERQNLGTLMSESLSRFRAPDRRSGLGVVQLPQVFFAIFFFDILFAILLALTGTTTRAPAFEEYPDWYLYFTFANASVYEEFAARTLLLGIPLMLAYIMAYSTRARPSPGPYGGTAMPAPPSGPAPRQQDAPAAAPIAAPKPDSLIDGQADDPSTRLMPRVDDGRTPIAAAPARRPPEAAPPPLPPLAEELLAPPPPAEPPSRAAPGPSVPPAGGTAAPFPPPAPAGAEQIRPGPPRQPEPAGQHRSRTLGDHLRSRTTNGLWGYFLGGGFRIGPLEAFFIIGSALMFGYAHVAGWDLWKMLPTFIAGLGFGYLFLKVGIHAAILLHFSFDYLALGQALLPGFGLMELLLLVLWTIVGAFYFGHYTAQSVKWLIGQLGKTAGEGERVKGQTE